MINAMKKKTDQPNDKDWGILVQGLQDQDGEGYFRAYLESEAGDDNQPAAGAICSTSKKGLLFAVANLCKRLDKRADHPFPATPAKWQMYFVNHEGKQEPLFSRGFLLINENPEYGIYFADLIDVPTFLLSDDAPEEIKEFVRQGLVGSVVDATGQTGFGALANLCRTLDNYGFAQTIDSLVLDPLAAGFFLPAAW